jgi:signal transduction histidine kinase
MSTYGNSGKNLMIPMKNIFKQFGVLATSSKADNFEWAVIRLTMYYTVGVFFILCVFSVLVYSLVVTDLEDNLHENTDETVSILEIKNEPILHEITENLFNILIFSDIVLLFLTIGVSYVLARKTLMPLKEAYQKQKKFVADAAHELRTPLAVQKAGAELLLQHERSVAEYKKFIEESQEETDRLITLSNDLLFLVQHKEQVQSSFEQFSLSQVCTTQSENIRSYALQNGVSLSMHIEEGIMMTGSRSDIARLILNLLKNAIDYNVPQGAVTLTLRKDNSLVVLSVTDTGIGIHEKNIPYIFERFYKADSSRTVKTVSGSGLGLSIVKEIVVRHGGLIKVESALGKGTTFELRFSCV